MPPANRSVVILIGGLRSSELAWKTLYDNVLDPNSADLILMTNDNSAYPNSSLFDRAKFVWHYHQFDDWADAVDLVNGTGWRITHLPKFREWYPNEEPGKNRSILFRGIKGHGHVLGIIIFMIRYFLIQAIEYHGILSKYNIFLVTRTDHYYLCPHMFSKDKCNVSDRKVMVPDGEVYFGITDRHLIASRDTLIDAFDLITPLITALYVFDHEKHHNSERYIWAARTDKKLIVKEFGSCSLALPRATLPGGGLQKKNCQVHRDYSSSMRKNTSRRRMDIQDFGLIVR